MKRKQVFWFALGLLLGAILMNTFTRTQATPAVETRIIGGNGYLMGYDIQDSDGETICSDPYVWVATKEIDCD